MASVEQVDQGVTQSITAEEKATISEVMKEAQTLLEAHNDGANDALLVPLATVAGAIKNSQSRPIMLHKILGGFGSFVVEPPKNIDGSNGIGVFIQRAQSFPPIPVVHGGVGPVIVGCKAAVLYGTFDNNCLQLGYLLAWFKAESSEEHKVYVEAGDPSKLMEMEWEEVEQKLDASSSESYYFDSRTKAFASAKIKLQSDDVALLGANFNAVIFREGDSES